MNMQKKLGLTVATALVGGTKWMAMLGAAFMITAWPALGQAQEAAAQPAAVEKAPAKKIVKRKAASQNDSIASRGIRSSAACVGASTTAHVSIPHGKSVSLNLKQLSLPEPAWLRSIADPGVVKITPLTSRTPRSQFFLFGLKIGSTNLTFQTKEGTCSVVELSVGLDTSAVQAKIRELMPEETGIRVVAAADSLVLAGTAQDASSVDKAMTIAKAYLPKGSGSQGAGASGKPMGSNNAPAKGGAPADTTNGTPMMTQIVINPSGAPQQAGSVGGSVINMVNVAAPQQVMLEVKVAEVSKSLLDKVGVKFNWATRHGSWTHNLISDFLTGTTTNPSGATITGTKSNGNMFGIDAQKTDGLVRILAEPNVMAVSGQEGSFLAGGKIYIPVPQSGGVNGAGGITLEEKEFGVGLKFLPTVLAGGRINIRVAPEVSELSRLDVAGTSGLIGSVTNNVIIPVISTRRAATTVQLYDGQSFAIGGLIKSNTSANINAFPFLGEVPVLGTLFRSTDFQQDRTELVFVITPRLVKPLPPDYTLPTDKIADPNRAEYFLKGRLEGGMKRNSQPAEKPAEPQAAVQDKEPTSSPSGFELK